MRRVEQNANRSTTFLALLRRKIFDQTFHCILFANFLVIFLCTELNVITAHDHGPKSGCSYQVPSTDNVVLNVPLLLTEHFGNLPSKVSHIRRLKRRRLVRDIVLNHSFRQLRISLHFDSRSINPLPAAKQTFINSSLLPQAVRFWEQTLLVRPSRAPIRLSRRCITNHYYLDTADAPPACVDRCRAVTNCGEVAVPDEHLFQCRFCALPNPLACIFSGPGDGPGVADADFLLYVSAVDSTRCQNEDTIAYAAHCQQEAELDRPIAGHVNVCPGALSTHSHDREILLSTVKHEILHALGFSAGLYAFFRDSMGRPRTNRNRYNRPVSFDSSRGYYVADESTVRTVERDWWTAEGKIQHSVHLMVTERVRDEARRHFGCPELEGAELENQGGDGTALTHWEKRLFENEAMTGTHTQNPVYSRLTLALMEDSGWYKANYSVAEELHWGQALGCGFAMRSCGEWISMQMEKNESAAPFCNDIKHDGHSSLAVTRCTDQRDSLALCNLVPYKKALPADYRNFAALKGVRPEVRYYGGSVELADYCSYPQEFEWKSVNSTDRRRDSRCELEGNAPPEDTNAVLEVYGRGAKCLDLAVNWTERRCGRIKVYSQFMAGCYKFVCTDGRLHLRVHNSTKLYPCYRPGQSIHIRKIVGGWLREGAIHCPACAEICHYPSNTDSLHHNRHQQSTLQILPTDHRQNNSWSTILDQIPLADVLQQRIDIDQLDDGEGVPFAIAAKNGIADNFCLPPLSVESTALLELEVGDPLLLEPCPGHSIRPCLFVLYLSLFTVIIFLLLLNP